MKRSISCLVLSMVCAVAFAVPISGQTPVHKPGKPAQSGSRSASPAAAPRQTAAIISPIAPATAQPAGPAPVTGKIGSHVASKTNLAAASASALVPSAPRYIPMTIVNRNGFALPSVKPADVGIIEDGVRQKVLSIERWPLWLVVVLDVGRQIGPVKQLAVHRQLVYDLLYALGEDDHVAIVQYSDGIDLIQPWTKNVEEAEEAVAEKFQSGLDGQLWDSVSFATTDLLADKLGHKMIIVISDGIDDASREATYGRALGQLRETSTTLHIVNLSQYLAEQIEKEAYGMTGVMNVITSPSYIGRRKELRQYRDRIGQAPPKMLEATTESGGKLFMVAPTERPENIPKLVWQQIEGQFMVSYAPERDTDQRSSNPIRGFSAFVTRGDIEARTPSRLYAPIRSPRSAPAGKLLTRKP